MEQKRFYYPSQVFSGDHCIEKIADFLCTEDIVLLVTDESLYQLGLAQRVRAVFADKVSKVVDYTAAAQGFPQFVQINPIPVFSDQVNHINCNNNRGR